MRSLPFLMFLCFGSSVLAQTPHTAVSPVEKTTKLELPSGPLLHPAPEYSQWEILFTYPDEQKSDNAPAGKTKSKFTGADARPRKKVTTKTGQIVHEEETDLTNRTVDVWFNGAAQYTRGGNSTVWFETSPGTKGHSDYSPLPENGFRTLDWINPGNFAGTVPYGNGTCLVFTPGGYQNLDLSDPTQQADRLKAVDMVAYVDADTRMPVAVRTHGELRAYRFYPPPSQMQSLPADLADQIKKGQEGRAHLYAPAPRPY